MKRKIWVGRARKTGFFFRRGVLVKGKVAGIITDFLKKHNSLFSSLFQHSHNQNQLFYGPYTSRVTTTGSTNCSVSFHNRLRNFEVAGFDIRSESDVDGLKDSSVTWAAIDWLRSITKLPIVAKGVLTGKFCNNRRSDGLCVCAHASHIK